MAGRRCTDSTGEVQALSSGEVEGSRVKHQDADSCVLVVEHVDMLVCPRSTKG